MPLSAEQVYNDLSGDEVKEILLTRFADLLNGVREFNPNLTLPRVRMTLNIHLEISGRTPPTLDIPDDLIVRMRDPNQAIGEPMEEVKDLEAVINSDTTTSDGQPPDQIREEHGIPIMEPQRGPMGIQDVPVLHPDRIKYAFNVTQDYGPARGRTGMEGPVVGGEVIGKKNAGASPDVKPVFQQKDPGYKPGDVNY